MNNKLAVLGLTLTLSAASSMASASLLYQASLKSGAYGGGYQVDTFSSCSDPTGRTCGDGDLSNIGISDTVNGVVYTSTEPTGQSNALINWSIGADYGAATQNSFRTQGTMSVDFLANSNTHVGGDLFVDNPGFNTFRGGQATFGASLGRTAADEVVLSWNTWHSGVWYNHGSATLQYDQWYDIGLTWGGPDHAFELWVDGILLAFDDTARGAWGFGSSAYNWGLGDNHQRTYDFLNGYGATAGVTFANAAIWDEHRACGDTLPCGVPPIPEPATLALFGLGLAGLGFARRRKSA